jgi:hypothetical protein
MQLELVIQHIPGEGALPVLCGGQLDSKIMFRAEGAGAVLSCCIGCKRLSLSILLEIIVLRHELIGLHIVHLIVHDLTTLMVFACFRSSRAVCACVFGSLSRARMQVH